MSRKIIPQETIITCDCCEKKITSGIHRASGALLIKQDLRDWQGMPCANGSKEYDICDNCLPKIAAAFENTAALIRRMEKKP